MYHYQDVRQAVDSIHLHSLELKKRVMADPGRYIRYRESSRCR